MLSTLGKLIKYLRHLRGDENGAASGVGAAAMTGIVMVGLTLTCLAMDQHLGALSGRIVAGLGQVVSGATTGTAPIIDASGASG
jgi:hypothetical protein